MTETKKADLTAAQTLRDELESQLGEAVEAINESLETVNKLKAVFSGDPDRTEEYQEASKWQERLLFADVVTVLAQVSGDEDDEEPDDDAPARLMIERKKLKWLATLVEFARNLDTAEFQQGACDEVLVDIQHALG